MELLQELRVASLGIQVLFAFLLGLPFTTRFVELDADQRRLYMGVLLLTAVAAAQLSGPVAYHRAVFRRHKKDRLLAVANVLALTGLATVGVSLCGAVLLVSTFLLSLSASVVIVVALAGVFVFLWAVLPLAGRQSGDHGSPSGGIARVPDR